MATRAKGGGLDYLDASPELTRLVEKGEWEQEFSYFSSAPKTTRRNHPAKAFNERNIRHARNNNTAKPPKAVSVFAADKPKQRIRLAAHTRIQQNCHGRPLNPAHWNISSQIRDHVFSHSSSKYIRPDERRNKYHHTEEKSHQQADDSASKCPTDELALFRAK